MSGDFKKRLEELRRKVAKLVKPTAANTYRTSNGGRECRACKRMHHLARSRR